MRAGNEWQHVEILDQGKDLSRWIPARRRRLLLAAYYDLMLFSIPWALLAWGMDFLLPAGLWEPVWVEYLVFAVLELLFFRSELRSPGLRALGIRFVNVRAQLGGIARVWQGRLPLVDRKLHEAESWLTMLLGICLVNAGSKSVVRWTMWSPPFPLFGLEADASLSGLANIASGVLAICAGYLMLRVRLQALALALPLVAVSLISVLMSWSLWDPWMAEYVRRRRAYQGLLVRPGEVESMQALVPEAIVAALVLSLVLLLVAARRLRREASPPS